MRHQCEIGAWNMEIYALFKGDLAHTFLISNLVLI